MEKNNFFSIKQLTVSSLCIALAVVLSMIKFANLPFGGSVTAFSMIFACMPGMLYGLPIGIISGLVYGLVQFILGPYVLTPVQVAVDYGFAFGALGLSGIFVKSKYSFTLGYICGVVGRYIFAVLSGYIFFAEYAWEGWAALPYSICYNALYIVPEAIASVIILSIPPVRDMLLRFKKSL